MNRMPYRNGNLDGDAAARYRNHANHHHYVHHNPASAENARYYAHNQPAGPPVNIPPAQQSPQPQPVPHTTTTHTTTRTSTFAAAAGSPTTTISNLVFAAALDTVPANMSVPQNVTTQQVLALQSWGLGGANVSDALELRTVPGTEIYPGKTCNFIHTKQWSCSAGFFCMSPNTTEKPAVMCPPGYLCPENTFEPLYCCPSYYCPSPGVARICPAGYYCPVGSIAPIACSFLAVCPEGSSDASRYYAAAFLGGLLVIVLLIFGIRALVMGTKSRKYIKRMAGIELEKAQRKEERERERARRKEEEARRKEVERQQVEMAESAARAMGNQQGYSASYSPNKGTGYLAVPVISGGDSGSESDVTEWSDDDGSSSDEEPDKYGSVPTANVRTFDIKFDNLGLTLGNGTAIMKNVSGTLASGRLCAIMGPSGAGKSTFISLLTGKAKRTTGNVLINGKHDELSHYKKLIGFVPQEDVMLRELTVRQILMHSALMRLPTQMSYKQKKNTVLETISFLGLQGVMDSAIGDEEVRGISGGQRKRVNIGMELVAQPSVMFLDEPTSGLDSSTSKEVCELLKQLAHKQGLTVAAVIHSPSPAAYAQFDDLLLLGKGGGVVFFGPASEAPAYFAHLGFPLPPSTSPPDFYMDVLTGRTKRIAGPSEPSDGVFKPSYLFGCWDAKCKGNDPLLGLTAELLGPVRWGSLRGTGAANRLMRKKTRRQAREEETKQNLMSPTYGSVGTQVKPNAFKTAWYAVSDYFHDVWVYMVDVWEEAFSAITCGLIGRGDQSGRRTASPFVVFWLCLKRATYQNFRSPVLFIFDQIVHVMVGGFISIIADNKDYVGLQPTQVCLSAPPALQKAGCVEPADALRNVGQFICIGTLFAGISVGASTFGRERVVFWRDTAAGMPTFPYFIAKIVADIPRIIVASIACCCTLLILLPLRGSILYFALDVFLLYAAAFSMGYFLSSIMSYRSVTIWSTAFVLVWALVFNGVSPSIADIGKYPEPAQALWAISAPRWAIEAYYIREMEARDWYELKGNRTGVVGVTVQDYVKASGANSSASASMESGFEGMGIKNETIVGELRYGYHYAHKDLAFVYLSLVVVMWMGLAFFGMKLTNRNRQK